MLPTEPAERFLQLSTELEDEFRPSTPFQRLQVESIAACAWRIRRVWALEKTAYKYEAGLMGPCQLPPDEKTYRSFRAMADFTRALELLSRYESRYERQMARAYKTLMDYDPENAPIEPNPTIEHLPTDAQPIDSTPEIPPEDGIPAQHTADHGRQGTDHHPHAMALSSSTPEVDPRNGVPAQHTADPGPRTPGPGLSGYGRRTTGFSGHGPRTTGHGLFGPRPPFATMKTSTPAKGSSPRCAPGNRPVIYANRPNAVVCPHQLTSRNETTYGHQRQNRIR
ncbi:MAG TPA: hypothetical protein VFA04_08040 [Bryobacteraceae bacterium]|nr:hypothetical protein [Bryobacteraceae bacterium]